jgi:hypothetical protein
VVNDLGSCIAIGPGIDEGQPCLCQGAPRGAVSPDALPLKVCILNKKSRTRFIKKIKKNLFFAILESADRIFSIYRSSDFSRSYFFFYGHSMRQSWGPIRVLVSRARRLKSASRRHTLGRSVEFHTVSASVQKYRILNLRKPKFTEIWFKSISACALNLLHGIPVLGC